jgi:hypothetical protein
MEIHAPSKPIETFKDFLLHLATIIVGILIALGLEQSVEAWHRHHLAEQARQNILSEIRDNKKQIEGSRKGAAENKKKLAATLETVRKLLAHKKLDETSMTISVNGATLSSASWATASATGALAFLGYEEVKRFAGAYDGQRLLEKIQDENFRTASVSLSLLVYGGSGPENMSDAQLHEIERNVLNCLGGITMWEQLAQQLDAEYTRVLSK